MTLSKLEEALGVHRAVSPRGCLPQAAYRLENDPSVRYPSEIHLEVETLNVDSASMRQLTEAAGGDPARVAAAIEEIVTERGKLHNPVTGSGGMLLGRVVYVGEDAQETARRAGVSVGDRVATLVSLTLTPLSLRRIVRVRLDAHQVDVEGTAVIFASGMLARMPDDLPERVALGALDVAGAAPQVLRLAQPGERVLVLGAGGKSGLLCGAAARRKVGPTGTVVGIEPGARAAAAARRLGYYDLVVETDATDPLACLAAVSGEFDLTVSCVNVEAAEMTAILATRDRGRVYFFSMATSFARAALGAEGVSRDVDMLVGNGYCAEHAQTTLSLLREETALREEFFRRFSA
jgi:L-erythro-3,5-diaminohexanoate dehydrogenase